MHGKTAANFKTAVWRTGARFSCIQWHRRECVGVASIVAPLGVVVCAQTAHINVDESVAPQWVGGFKLWAIATPDGKLSPELIAQEAHGFGFEHRAQPLAVSMTQSTELGTLYTPDELRAICDFCHKNGMAVHLDGARLANAAAALGVSLREITTDVGVDIESDLTSFK